MVDMVYEVCAFDEDLRRVGRRPSRYIPSLQVDELEKGSALSRSVT